MFQKFIIYIKLSLINAYRKEASDWKINIYLWPKIRFTLNCILPIFLMIFTSGISLLLKNDNSISNIILFILMILILSQSLFFFSKKKKIFLEDDLKAFNKSSDFRFIRIISEMLFSIIIQIVYYYIAIFMPIYLMTNYNDLDNLLTFLKISILFSLISLVSTLFFSFIQFIFHKHASNLKVFKATTLLRNILLIISLFILSYFTTTTLINNAIAQKMMAFLNSSQLFNLGHKIINILLSTINFTNCLETISEQKYFNYI